MIFQAAQQASQQLANQASTAAAQAQVKLSTNNFDNSKCN